MKTATLLALSLFAISSYASARVRGPVTVDHMTCSEAQAYTLKYKRYYKNMGPDGAIPIYPVLTIPELKVGKCFVAPIVERTANNAHCIVGYYCNSF